MIRHRRHAAASGSVLGIAVAILTASIPAGCSSASPSLSTRGGIEPEASPPDLVRHSLLSTATGLERDYYVYLPRGYFSANEARWPVILFLHGNGERGDGKEELGWVMSHGPLYEAWIQRRDLPFVIVAPQLPMFDRKYTVSYLENRDQTRMPRRRDGEPPPRAAEFETPEPMTGTIPDSDLPFGPEGPPSGWSRYENELLEIIDVVLTNYWTDPDRLYLTGLSYGGYGTWFISSRHPGLFAAIAPIVGWGHPDLMAPLADPPMPVWAFAGGRDDTVPDGYFFAGLNEIERLGHPDVRFTIHEDSGHDAWKRVYAGKDIYDWFLSHRRADRAVTQDTNQAEHPDS